MSSIVSLAKNLWSDQEGQGMVEYALILALVAVVAITLLQSIGNDIQDRFNDIVNAL